MGRTWPGCCAAAVGRCGPELARIYFEQTKTAANAQALADALLVLEGEAQGVDPTEVALRVGRSADDGRLVLDLGGDDGRAVVIGAYGWEIVDISPVLFWRTNATLPLPTPDRRWAAWTTCARCSMSPTPTGR